MPRVFSKDSSITELPAEEVQFDDKLKYFINVGSVGQPRNGDWRACYAIYDIPANTLVYRRLEYDIVAAQKKVIAAGLPEMLATRLAEGR